MSVSGARNCAFLSVSGSRHIAEPFLLFMVPEIVTFQVSGSRIIAEPFLLFLGPEIVTFCQFQRPEIAPFRQFLGP